VAIVIIPILSSIFRRLPHREIMLRGMILGEFDRDIRKFDR